MLHRFRRIGMPHRFWATLALAATLVTGCATVPPASDPQALAEFRERNDPWEPLNRGVHGFNQGVDDIILKPLAQIYHFILPNFIEERITRIFRNATEPWTAVNDLLQGNPESVRAASQRCIQQAGGGRGFVLGSGCIVPRYTPIENLQEMVRVARKTRADETEID